MDPLEAIGQFFEMPTKEAFLNKVDPVLSFFQTKDASGTFVFFTIILLGLGAYGLFTFLRNRRG